MFVFSEYAGSEGKALMMTAESALAKSCFSTIDWKISEDAKVSGVERKGAYRAARSGATRRF